MCESPVAFYALKSWSSKSHQSKCSGVLPLKEEPSARPFSRSSKCLVSCCLQPGGQMKLSHPSVGLSEDRGESINNQRIDVPPLPQASWPWCARGSCRPSTRSGTERLHKQPLLLGTTVGWASRLQQRHNSVIVFTLLCNYLIPDFLWASQYLLFFTRLFISKREETITVD